MALDSGVSWRPEPSDTSARGTKTPTHRKFARSSMGMSWEAGHWTPVASATMLPARVHAAVVTHAALTEHHTLARRSKVYRAKLTNGHRYHRSALVLAYAVAHAYVELYRRHCVCYNQDQPAAASCRSRTIVPHGVDAVAFVALAVHLEQPAYRVCAQ